MSQETLERIRTALAAMLCAGEPHCPKEREARQLCVAAMQELNKVLNTNKTRTEHDCNV